MKELLGFGSAFALAFVITLSISKAADDAQPKHTIKAVMKAAHKDGLMRKVAGGMASKEEKQQLLEYYQALAANTPPKGDAADWKTRTAALVVFAQEVVDGKMGSEAQLVTVVNCQDCHKTHK